MEREGQFVGQSSEFLDAVERTSRAAPMRRPVLVIGERGTGKELIAERLHQLSRRWQEPLVTLNCAALPETLIEAELFGHEAGAFTGATRARAGRFEEADKGTLFLDELATLSMGAQERLLRAVEYGEVTRIGSSRPIRVDVRIVAATNEDLPRLAEQGRFRADLLDRLSFEVITLPPLRVREGDIYVLAEYFGRRMASELGWEQWPGFTEAAMRSLEDYQWPGNVRELRNVVERAVYRWDTWDEPVGHIVFDPFSSPWKPQPMLTADRGGPAPASAARPAPTSTPVPSGMLDSVTNLRAAVDAHEKAILEAALARHRYNQRQTAKALSLSYDQLRHAMKKHGLMEKEA
jgi:psp operon transcriptional activator